MGAVTDQHPPSRSPGISRLLALVVLLGGIVAMHAGVFGSVMRGRTHMAEPRRPELSPVTVTLVRK
jgi:hypothetical protein